MKTADFTYHRPTAPEEALALLERLQDEDAKIIAGGQSLLPIMNMRLAEPAHLIDITHIPSLRDWTETETGIGYGATTTHMRFESGLVPDPTRGLLSWAARGIGYPAIRNRGTIAGSLAHADASAEWPTIMSGLGAQVLVASASGRRRLDVRQFLHGFFTTDLRPDEMILAVDVPQLPPSREWAMFKTARKPGEFAESIAVLTFDLGADDAMTKVDPWLGAARDVPLRLDAVAKALEGRRRDEVSFDEVLAPLARDLHVDLENSDVAARHKAHIHGSTILRALRRPRRGDGQ